VDGEGVSGSSTNASGVHGTSTNSAGVFGNSSSTGTGVSGQSVGGAGVGGGSTNGSGVFGVSTHSNGVSGLSTKGEGVVGVGPVSEVHGTSGVVSGVGVLAQNVAGGDALKVRGRANFSTAGTAVIASGQKSVTVILAAVTTSDFVLATVQGAGSFSVKNAVAGSGQFTIFINKAPISPATMIVVYFVISA
jgi:hypothetical protein